MLCNLTYVSTQLPGVKLPHESWTISQIQAGDVDKKADMYQTNRQPLTMQSTFQIKENINFIKI